MPLSEEPPSWYVVVRTVEETGRYLWPGPERFCFPTTFGLCVRRHLASRFEPGHGGCIGTGG